MNVLYEEDGGLKVGAILADNTTSLQVEAPHGRRSKIKASAVMLKFEQPPLAEFMAQAEEIAQQLDVDFLWQCCGPEEFSFADLAHDYFGREPAAVATAAVLLRLHAAPMYFYKKGKGKYRAAPEEALKAALAGVERRRLQAQRLAEYVAQLAGFTLPEAFAPLLPALLYQPDKNSLEFKALEQACALTHLSPAQLVEKCGGLPSSHDYHFNRFLFERFPHGAGFAEAVETREPEDLPTAEVAAFSIDDAATTEIDDAFSVTPLPNGNWRIGIHIAAPALGITPGSPLDAIAAQRLSTVYIPGSKITMLPEQAIEQFSLQEGRACPALSLYLDITAEDCAIVASESRVERVPVTANLRHEALEQHFTEATMEEEGDDHPFRQALAVLWRLATRLEQGRVQPGKNATQFRDYSFLLEDDRVYITERKRGSPIDKVVSELMIHANAHWGGQLAEADMVALYRTQTNGKVRMSTRPAPHQGLGVAQYVWASSPLRRYADLVNQRQLLALLGSQPAPYSHKSDALFIALREFEAAYEVYADIQRTMERYWCLRYLLQEGWTRAAASVIGENLVRLEQLPLVARLAGMPALPPGTPVEVELSQIDLLQLTFSCTLAPAAALAQV